MQLQSTLHPETPHGSRSERNPTHQKRPKIQILKAKRHCPCLPKYFQLSPYDSFPSVVGRLVCMHFLLQNLNNQQHTITLSNNKNSLEFNPEQTSDLRLHICVLKNKDLSLSSFILSDFMLNYYLQMLTFHHYRQL